MGRAWAGQAQRRAPDGTALATNPPRLVPAAHLKLFGVPEPWLALRTASAHGPAASGGTRGRRSEQVRAQERSYGQA